MQKLRDLNYLLICTLAPQQRSTGSSQALRDTLAIVFKALADDGWPFF